MGHGLDFLLDCGCVPRDYFRGNNHYDAGTKIRKPNGTFGWHFECQWRYPTPHKTLICRIRENKMSDVNFKKHPTKRCQILKVILTLCNPEVANRIFLKLKEITAPHSWINPESFFRQPQTSVNIVYTLYERV